MADSISVALVSAIAGGALTYVTTIMDLAAQYDAGLRHDRIDVYKKLWKLLQPLARYAPPGEFTLNRARELAVALRVWYFEEGGLFLSEAARDAYFALQEALKNIGAPSEEPVPPGMLKLLMNKGSTLRTHLSSDVGTRAKAMLGR